MNRLNKNITAGCNGLANADDTGKIVYGKDTDRNIAAGMDIQFALASFEYQPHITTCINIRSITINGCPFTHGNITRRS